MNSVKLTVSLKSGEITMPQVASYKVGLGAQSATLPPPTAGVTSLVTMFNNVEPGDYSIFCTAMDAAGNAIGATVTASVVVGADVAAPLIPNTIQAEVIKT